MSKWNCFTCKVAMEDVDDVHVTFNGTDLPDAEGWRCPVCGAEFIGSEFVTEQLSASEQMLQGK